MKKIKVLSILILICSFYIKAQDYQTVKSDRIAFFKNEYGGVNCIRIDSVKYIADSIFYPFSNIQQIGSDCFTPYGASWIGYEIITQVNGFAIFLNNERDSIKIKANSILNESWTAYLFADSSTVLATLLSIDTLTILGQLDSIKTIGFQVYDKSLNPVNDKLNTMSIVLSKNYGMVKTLPFSLFPDNETDYYNEYEFQEYHLIGLSNPKLGIQNLGWFEVHDFQVGDEIHISYESSYWEFPEAVIKDSSNIIFKYLGRKDMIDTIIYTVEKIQSRKETHGVVVSFNYMHDTIITLITPNPMFERLPGEIIFSNNEISSNTMNSTSFLSKTEPSVYNTYQHSMFDSCWSYLIFDGCFTSDTYIKGLGGPYYECSNFMAGGGIENKLVYYKKGNVSWGTPFVITAIPENCLEDEIKIYPNPAKDIIYVTVQNPGFALLLEVTNIEGKVFIASEITSGSSTINIENLNPGIYIYRFSKNSEMIKSGKIIIQ